MSLSVRVAGFVQAYRFNELPDSLTLKLTIVTGKLFRFPSFSDQSPTFSQETHDYFDRRYGFHHKESRLTPAHVLERKSLLER